MAMTVEMILRLIDQATGPMRGVENELKNLKKEADSFDKARAAGGKVRAHVWVEEQKRLAELRAQQAELEKHAAKLHGMERAAIGAGAGAAMLGVSTKIAHFTREAATHAASYQDSIQKIATAGDLIGKERAIGKSILDASTASGVEWKDVAAGSRKMAALGGGEYLEKMSPFHTEIAKLAKASEASTEELYNMMFHYMELNKNSAQEAMDNLKVNFVQGRRGAYELKDLAHGMPSQIALGRAYGLDKHQTAVDLPALLQIERKATATPGVADTYVNHLVSKLTDPNYAKRILKDTGVDIFKVRDEAIRNHADPLFSVMDKLYDKIKTLPGTPNSETEKIEGVDARKLSEIGRDYYFRQAVTAYGMQRQHLKEFMPSVAESVNEVQKAYAANTSTATAAMQRFSAAAEAASIKLMKPWLPLGAGALHGAAYLTNKLGDWADSHPNKAMGSLYGGSLITMGALGGAAKWGAMAALEKLGLGTVAAGGLGAAMGRGALTVSRFGGPLGMMAMVAANAEFHEAGLHNAKEEVRYWRDRVLGTHGEAFGSVAERMRQMHYDPPAPTFMGVHTGRRKGLNTYAGPEAPMTIGGGGATLPAFAQNAGVTPTAGAAMQGAAPKVDTSDLQRAAQEAETVGTRIKEALNVTVTPKASADGFGEAQAAAERLLATIQQIGTAAHAASRAVSSAAAAAGSVSPGAHALHDGPEAH